MFGWFKPSCPLATAEKVWVESRMAWLTETLGSSRLLKAAVIEPTDEFFPKDYQQRDADAIVICRQVREWMEVDADRVTFEIHDQIGSEDPLGLYVPGSPARILIRRSELTDPESLVATVAHELAHEILLGGGHLQENNDDTERLTDLATVFCGLGIFSANSKLREQTIREGRFSWWSISKHGYLPMRMHGYALGLFAWARGEQQPEWAQHLRLDVRDTLQKGLRYLTKSGDCVFRIDRPAEAAGGSDPEAAAAWLTHASRSFRFLGLSQLIEFGTVPGSAIGLVAELTHDRDRDISSVAALLLGVIGSAASQHMPRLLDMLSSPAEADRESAAWSLGQFQPAEPICIRELTRLLEDPCGNVSIAAAEALGNYGGAAASAEKPLLFLYKQGLIECSGHLDRMAAAILRIFPDAPQRVRDYFIQVDDELCRLAEDCLAEARQHSSVLASGEQ